MNEWVCLCEHEHACMITEEEGWGGRERERGKIVAVLYGAVLLY